MRGSEDRLKESRALGLTYRYEETLAQRQKPTKSRAWLEAECLKLARTHGGSEIQRVTIRRLRPKGSGPNWKVADIVPQPKLEVSIEVRKKLARLPGRYALEDEI
jgi:hypothetical protein